MEAKPTLELLKLEDLGFLGVGAFAQVRKARYNNQLVAVKILMPTHDSKAEADFFKEVNELRKSNHDNIIKIFAIGLWKDKVDVSKCMVIELADMGSLHHVLHDEPKLPYTIFHAISWLVQTARAVNYLHTRPPKLTIHRDLKPLNLLLMHGGTLLKVCDFGCAGNLKTMMTLNKGSVCWISPEVISNDNYNEKCDCYSYAVILFEVLSRQKPYFHLPNPNSNQIMFNVVLGRYRPKKISKCPRILDILLERCLDGDPDKRPSMQMILIIMEKLNTLMNKTPIKPLKEDSVPQRQISEASSGIFSDKSNNFSNTSANTLITSGRLSPKMLNILDDNENNGDVLLRNPGGQSYNKPIIGHRKSKSFGNHFEAPILKKPEIEKISIELKNRLETMLYDPIDPVYHDNRSIDIFNNHRKLIKEDELIQKNINLNKQQLDQLQTTIQNIKLHKELTKQKNLLKKENDRLNKMLADNM